MKHKAALLLALVIGALFAHPAHGGARCAALEQAPAPDVAASRDAHPSEPAKPMPAQARTAVRVAADEPHEELQAEQPPEQPVVPEAAPRPTDWRALLPGSLR